MKWNIHDVYEAFEGKLVGNFDMKMHVCQTLANMPDEVIYFITKNCWFMSSMEDAWAYTFRGNDIPNQYLIFLSDDLLNQNEKQIKYSIAHEIGHVMLRHRNSVYSKQSKGEIDKQESEADNFAKKYA